jgi:alkylhydroperoxidase family enzyme
MRILAFAILLFGLAPLAAQPEPAPAPKPKPPANPFPPIADAWAKLPPRKDPPLPEWAKVLAGSLPKTTAKMLELDYFHREKNPLGAVLAARVRREVASALRSDYGVAVAEADLKRAGLSDREIESNPMFRVVPESESVALRFAKKLTEEGHAITDKEFAEVLGHFGPEETTALVHTVAYANFHNRVLFGLGVRGESPPAPPFPLKFDYDAAKLTAPARPPWDDLKAVKAGGLSVRVAWSEGDADALNRKLESQKERKLRIPLPDQSVYDKLPPKEKDSSRRILWNTVSMGYQPEMTRAWFAALYAYYEEAKPDRVFTNSTFWVVTRTNDCFY